MQLRPGRLGWGFAVLGPALLLVAGPMRAAPGLPPDGAARAHTVMRASAELASYADTDAVRVVSPSVAGTISDDIEGWSVGGRYLLDAVSAASVDIVSSASPHWFEYRHVGSANVDYKPGGAGLSVSGTLSREPDYLSISGGGTVSFDLLNKNLTPFFGASYGHDDVGRTGEPHIYWHTLERFGVQAGATFVVDRSTIASVSVDGSFERGYLAKPYRFIPLFAPEVASSIAAGASGTLVNQRRMELKPDEVLPDARDRYSVSAKIAHRFDLPVTFRVDERLYRDSWSLLASSSDAHVMIDVGTRLDFTLHTRFHAQTGVSFWQRAYTGTPAPDGSLGLPLYRAGERELGPLTEVTLGGGLRWRVVPDPHNSWTLSVQVDDMRVWYFDALFIRGRNSLFGVLAIESEFY